MDEKQNPEFSYNICVIIWTEREGKEGGTETIFKEIMAENFQNLRKVINLQIQEADWTLSRINPKKFIPRHTIITFLKTKGKEKILKAAREMTQCLYRKTVWMTVDLLSANMETRKKWHKILRTKEIIVIPEFYIQLRYSSERKRKPRCSQVKEKRTYHQRTYREIMSKEISWNRKEIIQERNYGTSGKKKEQQRVKI